MATLSNRKCILNQNINEVDFSRLLKWFHDFESMKYFSLFDEFFAMRFPRELKSFYKNFLKQHPLNQYVYIFTKKKKFVGYIVLIGKTKEIGLFIGKPYWRKGYAYNSMILFLDYFFNTLNFRKSKLSTCVKNISAIKLYKKIGYKETKKERNAHPYLTKKNLKIVVKNTTRIYFELSKKQFNSGK